MDRYKLKEPDIVHAVQFLDYESFCETCPDWIGEEHVRRHSEGPDYAVLHNEYMYYQVEQLEWVVMKENKPESICVMTDKSFREIYERVDGEDIPYPCPWCEGLDVDTCPCEILVL